MTECYALYVLQCSYEFVTLLDYVKPCGLAGVYFLMNIILVQELKGNLFAYFVVRMHPYLLKQTP